MENNYNYFGIDKRKYIIDSYEYSNDELYIYVRKKKEKLFVCPSCGSISVKLHSYKRKIIKHAHFTCTICYIHIKQRLMRCIDCYNFFLEQIDFISNVKNISKETLFYILTELRKKQSFKEIALRANVSTQSVINIFEKHVNCRPGRFPEIICIDAFCYKHGKTINKYACIIIDFITGEIIDIIESRKHDFLIPYINEKIPQKEKNGVKYVISDMYEGYEYLTKYQFPNATFVIDSFHYIRYITNAFDSVRIRIQKNYTTKSTEYYLLKKYCKLLLKFSFEIKEIDKLFYNKKLDRYISKNDIIDMCINIDEELKHAYSLKEFFFRSFNNTFAINAEKFIEKIIFEFSTSGIHEFISVSKTFKNWKEGIINSFTRVNNRHLTNGPVEGVNNSIKTIIKISYGYSNFIHLRNRIMYIVNKKKNYISNQPNHNLNLYRKKRK